VVGAFLLAAGVLAGCSRGEAQGQGGGAPPPPQVGVIKVEPQSLPLVVDLPGRLEALRTAEVRARVTGIVEKRRFTEGSEVKQGQALYAIDSAPYRAARDSAKAQQARAQAALAQAKANLARNKPLAEARAISQQEWQATEATYKQAVADVAAARAAVQQADLSLGYAAVRAPISGRIGRSQVSEGALVSQTEGTLMATIQQVDKLYVNFTQPATDALRLQRQASEGKVGPASDTNVRVVLEDGTEYPHPAKLLFSDLTVDPTSGQVTLRAELPNPERALLPGLYVRVKIAQATIDNAALVPQQAVTRGSDRDTVMVVTADGKAAPRTVKLGGQQGSSWVVIDGLKAGEQVIVDGFQKMRPNAPVQPVPWKPEGGASAPAGAGSGAAAGGAAASAAPASAASR